MSDPKISPHSLNDLKNTTDDALGNYLRSLSFTQDNRKLDFRLLVGYVSVIIAAATFVADYKLGWEATKGWTAVAVAAYALLNGVFSYWMWAVEKGLVFEGSREGKTISLASKTKKHDPKYYLTVSVTSSSSATPSTWQLACPFTTWFTADGYFVAQPFQQWLAGSIVVIGDVDTKHARKEEVADLLSASGVDVGEMQGNGTPGAGKGKKGKRKG